MANETHDLSCVNSAIHNDKIFTPHSTFDTNYSGIEDKFANSILHAGTFVQNVPNTIDTDIHDKWREQSQFDFGFGKCQVIWPATNALIFPPLNFTGG